MHLGFRRTEQASRLFYVLAAAFLFAAIARRDFKRAALFG